MDAGYQRNFTAIDELVSQRLEEIANQYEEQKIQHERQCQDELRQLD